MEAEGGKRTERRPKGATQAVRDSRGMKLQEIREATGNGSTALWSHILNTEFLK